jgi:putative FmdB family regulatory protein
MSNVRRARGKFRRGRGNIYRSEDLSARVHHLPLYEYRCRNCRKVVERIEKLNGPHLKSCPHCKGRVERIVSRSAIQFKGSGWYVTDYARSSAPPGDSGKQEPAPAAAAEKTAAGPDGKPKGKPAPASKGKKTGTAEK